MISPDAEHRGLFGLRTPLHSRECFLGWEDRVQQIVNAIHSEFGAEGSLVIGPPRSGRTSVFHQIQTEAARRDQAEAVVAIVDVKGCEGDAQKGLDMIIDAIREATRALAPPAKELRDAIPAALARIPGRLVIAVDNFDHLAPYLRRDDQAVIRASAGKDMCWVLSVSSPLEECLEFFGDSQSDVVDVVKQNTIVLAPLSVGDLEAGLREAQVPVSDKWAAFLFSYVGGFAAWLQLAIVSLLQIDPDTLAQGPAALEASARSKFENDLRDILGNPVRESALALDSRARHALDHMPTPKRDTQKLRLAGFLGEDGGWSGTIIGEITTGQRWLEQRLLEHPRGDRYDRLSLAIDAVNAKSWQAGGEAVVSHGRVASRQVQPYLRRTTKSDADAQALLKALRHLFLQGQRGNGSSPLASLAEPTKAVYKLKQLYQTPVRDNGLVAKVDQLVDELIHALRDLVLSDVTPVVVNDGPVRWLHISDLHIQGDHSYDQDLVLDALVRLAKDEPNPDFIIVTGDIAFSGQAKEYAQADKFFDDLLDATELRSSPERLIVVPGNHDVDRSKVVGLARTLSDEAESQAYFGLPNLPHLAAQGDFWAWYERRLSGARECRPGTTCGPIVELPIRTYRLVVLPINSSLFARADDDSGKLWIGRRAFRRQLKELEDRHADLRIFAMHHPPGWLADDERAHVRDYLREHANVVLTGHLHEPDVVKQSAPTEVIQVAAGATQQGSQRSCRLFYASFERQSHGSKICFEPFAYYDEKERWLIDPAVFPNTKSHVGCMTLAGSVGGRGG